MTSRTYKKIGIITIAICMVVTLFAPFKKADAQYLVPFGGYIVNVDYATCSCGFVIFDIYDKTKQTEYRIIWFYLAQLLSDLGLEMPDLLEMGIPRIYAYGAIWPGSEASVVGNFVPYPGAICAVISSTGCSVAEPGAAGYLLNMGTSVLGTQ